MNGGFFMELSGVQLIAIFIVSAIAGMGSVLDEFQTHSFAFAQEYMFLKACRSHGNSLHGAYLHKKSWFYLRIFSFLFYPSAKEICTLQNMSLNSFALLLDSAKIRDFPVLF